MSGFLASVKEWMEISFAENSTERQRGLWWLDDRTKQT